MIEKYLIEHCWIPVLLWILLYSSDYYLTLLGARLRRAQHFYESEGSYELNPAYQNDIDKQKKLSPQFLGWLLFGCAVFLSPKIAGMSTDRWARALYGFYVGALIVTELAVHIRHVQNIALYRRLVSAEPGMTGSIQMSRWLAYTISATQSACLAAFIFGLFAITLSPVLLGGALGLISSASQHNRLAKHWKQKNECEDPSSLKASGE